MWNPFSILDAANPLRILLDALTGLMLSLLEGMDFGGDLFAGTALDFSNPILDPGASPLWALMTAMSVALVLLMFVIGILRAMVQQSSAGLKDTFIGMIVALALPQVLTVLIPTIGTGTRQLAQEIMTAYVGTDLTAVLITIPDATDSTMYDAIGLMAPIVLGFYILGLMVFFLMLWVLMALGAVLWLFAPLACAGLVIPATRSWFKRWAGIMMGILLAPVISALSLAVAAGLFRYGPAGDNLFFALSIAGAGVMLLIAGLLSPMVGMMMFSWAGSGVTAGVGTGMASGVSGLATRGLSGLKGSLSSTPSEMDTAGSGSTASSSGLQARAADGAMGSAASTGGSAVAGSAGAGASAGAAGGASAGAASGAAAAGPYGMAAAAGIAAAGKVGSAIKAPAVGAANAALGAATHFVPDMAPPAMGGSPSASAGGSTPASGGSTSPTGAGSTPSPGTSGTTPSPAGSTSGGEATASPAAPSPDSPAPAGDPRDDALSYEAPPADSAAPAEPPRTAQ